MDELEEREKELKEMEEEKNKEEKNKENKDIDSSPVIEEARRVNVERIEILDREEKLQARKEKLHAEEMVAGKGKVTEEIVKKDLTEIEYAEAMEKGEVDPFKEDGYK